MGDENLQVYISEYYKKLFGEPAASTLTMNEDFCQDIPQLTSEENNILVAEFTEKEVKDAIFQMVLNNAPGPDGFPAEFYQKIWDVIKGDLMPMFYQLHSGELQLFKSNFGVIILLPKKENAVQIQQYRPIFLLNVSFKFSRRSLQVELTLLPNSDQPYAVGINVRTTYT